MCLGLGEWWHIMQVNALLEYINLQNTKHFINPICWIQIQITPK